MMNQNKQEPIYGIRSVIEALKAGKQFQNIFVQIGLKSELLKELRFLSKKSLSPIKYVEQKQFNQFRNKNHQGVYAIGSQIEYQNLEDLLPIVFEEGKTPLILILDRITDVRNFGAIARTAECTGVDAIVIPQKSTAKINAEALKTSAGALHTIPVVRSSSLTNTIKFVKQSGLKVVSCTEKTKKQIYDVDLTTPLALIFGSEEDGVRAAYRNASDECVTIPLFGEIASLNVSVAAGVTLFEVIRQREI